MLFFARRSKVVFLGTLARGQEPRSLLGELQKNAEEEQTAGEKFARLVLGAFLPGIFLGQG